MRTLIDDLLAEQQSLTPVGRFAQKAARGETPAHARYYRDFIPLTKPAPGTQYAFAVDLDACTGCKACVNACHSLNGLDEGEIWRTVGVLVGGTPDQPYQQTITTACHHCAQPACLLGCPVAAYEKDATTGIVRHLDDQCIGCQYCILKCPYDVPKYSTARGIVRKCDMCYDRLAADEAPACVQACPSGAIRIRIVTSAEIAGATRPGRQMIPGAFVSEYTGPTTHYTSRKRVPANARAGDQARLSLDPAHWPLVWMLALTQLSAGIFIFFAGSLWLPDCPFNSIAAPIVGFAVLCAGLVASAFHLGHWRKAWRFFLGLRTSWLSREILAFGCFAMVTGGVMLASVLDSGPTRTPAIAASASLAGAVALLAVFCSAMIYIDTRRPAWRASITFPKFFGTTLVLGAGTFAAICSWLGSPRWARATAITALVLHANYAVWSAVVFWRALRNPRDPTHRTTKIVRALLHRALCVRAALVLAAAIAGMLAVLTTGAMQLTSATALPLLIFAAAILERYFYFAAADAPRMPGGVAS